MIFRKGHRKLVSLSACYKAQGLLLKMNLIITVWKCLPMTPKRVMMSVQSNLLLPSFLFLFLPNSAHMKDQIFKIFVHIQNFIK